MIWAAVMIFGLSLATYSGDIGAGYGKTVGTVTDISSGSYGFDPTAKIAINA